MLLRDSLVEQYSVHYFEEDQAAKEATVAANSNMDKAVEQEAMQTGIHI